MIIKDNTLLADEGKVIRRKGTGEIYGNTLTLGYSYYIGGKLQNPPHKDIPSDFEAVPIPEEYDESNLYEEDVVEVSNSNAVDYVRKVREFIREKYSISDELAILRQRDTKPDEFREYFHFCEDCKQRAKNDIN